MITSLIISRLLIFNYSKENPNHFEQTSCLGYSSVAMLKFTNTVVLNQNFINTDHDINQIANDAIQEQLKFIIGNFKETESSQIRHISLAYEAPQTNILSINQTHYPHDLEIDSPLLQENLTPYLSKALQFKKTNKNDFGIEIQYSTDQKVYICNESYEKKSLINFYLPRDPYLAYWYMEPMNRQHLTWNKASNTVNPCVEDEFVDIPDPQYYWYFWLPRKHIRTKNESFLDCQKYLTMQNKLSEIQGQLISLGGQSQTYQLSTSKWEEQTQIKIRLIFGWTNTQQDPKTDLKALLKKVKGLLSGSTDQYLASNFIDPSSDDLFDYIANVRSAYNIRKYDIENKNDHFIVKINGYFTESKKPINLQIFWGPTDVLGKFAPKHWNFINEAIASADLIIYSGHSGLGENMNLLKHHTLPISTNKSHQIIAILSCSSISYFNPKQFLSEINPFYENKDIIYTASSLIKFSAIIQAIELTIDKSLSSKLPSKLNLAEDSFTDNLFVIYTHEKPRAEYAKY